MSEKKGGSMPVVASPVEDALKDLRRGQMVILVDDAEDQGEADLCLAGELTTPAGINFMATYGRGLICLSLIEDKLRELGIPILGHGHLPAHQRVFGASIEARRGVTTGISAYDRAVTITVAVRDNVGPEDIVMPGHVHPLLAHRGGVLARSGLSRARSIWCVWPDSSQRRPSVRSCVMTGPWPREKTSKNSPGSTPSRWSACRT